jgi:outer membrane receptor protein involved in Fe transport
LGFALAIDGLAAEWKGRVLSLEGRPVASALILHRPSGLKTETAQDGSFSIVLPQADKITLSVIHPDYMEEDFDLPARAQARPLVITLVPYIRQREEVVVTAMRHPEPAAEIPAASTVVTSETIERALAPNIAKTVDDLTGVTDLGSGGFSLVPSIRGLSRRRVLLMVDDARLSSDRRTGPSASFVSPMDTERIEILRSPSSVFYGSDAIGGVVHILTREPGSGEGLRGRVNARYSTVDQGKGAGIALSGGPESLGYYFSFQGVDAEDYHSPEAEVLQSRYTQAGFLGKIRHRTEKREISGSFLLARGRDIGKPNTDGPAKPTWYPREDQNLLQFYWKEKKVWGDGDLSFHVFANPNFLETRTDTVASYKTKEAYGKTDSTDYGAQLSFDKNVAPDFRLTAGLDWYGRSGAGAVNSEKALGPDGEVIRTFEERPYTQGSRRDVGFFISGDFSGIAGLDLAAGLRLDSLHSRANPGGGADVTRYRDQALTGFAAASVKLTDILVLFANVARAFRAPDLNELFYSGITGRGFIIANPDLVPESSFSVDGGLKVITRRLFVGFYGFTTEIKDMIERYQVAERTYTYANIEKGRIRGLELEWEVFPWSGFSLFGNAAVLNGKSLRTGDPLNDVPPERVRLGARAWLRRLSFEAAGTWQGEKADPGPAEIAIPSTRYFDFEVSYYFGPALQLNFLIANIFNESYLARPDPESVREPGRSFLLGVSYAF